VPDAEGKSQVCPVRFGHRGTPQEHPAVPHARRVVVKLGGAEKPGGGYRRLEGKDEENQVGAVDPVPGRRRDRGRPVRAEVVFGPGLGCREDLDEQAGEPAAVSLGDLPLAGVLEEPQDLPGRQRGEGQQRVEQVVGYGCVDDE
jgi:hypothetical protein